MDAANAGEDVLADLDNADLVAKANEIVNGKRSRVPTLRTTGLNCTIHMAETNEAKSKAFAAAFFPPKPVELQVLPNFKYLKWVNYHFQLQEGHPRHHLVKLKPHKALGNDGIPNVVLKESADQLAEYLLCIF